MKPDFAVSLASDPGILYVSAEMNDAWSNNAFMNEAFPHAYKERGIVTAR